MGSQPGGGRCEKCGLRRSPAGARGLTSLCTATLVQYRPLYSSLAMQLCVCVEISVPPLGTFIEDSNFQFLKSIHIRSLSLVSHSLRNARIRYRGHLRFSGEAVHLLVSSGLPGISRCPGNSFRVQYQQRLAFQSS